MQRSISVLAACAALALAISPVDARQKVNGAAGGAMPSCAAGDPVVWVNSGTHVIHEPGDPYYGKTRHGAYACKSAALAAHNHVTASRSGGANGAAAGSASAAGAHQPYAASPEPLTPQPATRHHRHHRGASGPRATVPQVPTAPVPARTR